LVIWGERTLNAIFYLEGHYKLGVSLSGLYILFQKLEPPWKLDYQENKAKHNIGRNNKEGEILFFFSFTFT
jgi:hypothetical protein